MKFFVGTAGWTIPRPYRSLFNAFDQGEKPSQLQLYASRFQCTEINSSFHRPHRRATWERWAAATPAGFRFAVKTPKAITHLAKLQNTGAALLEFFQAIAGLGEKLGPVLVQLPPKLAFDEGVAREFFTTLRELHTGSAVLEPRHASWFTASADRLLRDFELARVAADPPKGSPLASQPGGSHKICYWRLHGSPHTYYSSYEEGWLQSFAGRLWQPKQFSKHSETWLIFDNTALGHATGNALWIKDALNNSSSSPNTA